MHYTYIDYLFLLGRILLGGYFIRAGLKHFFTLDALAGYAQSKGVPMPKVAVFATGFMLLFGGFGVLFGVWVQWAVLSLVIFLVGVTYQMHQYWKIEDPMQRMLENTNFYKNIGLLGGVLCLLAIPLPWLFSSF